jgi:hypothetical protein
VEEQVWSAAPFLCSGKGGSLVRRWEPRGGHIPDGTNPLLWGRWGARNDPRSLLTLGAVGEARDD